MVSIYIFITAILSGLLTYFISNKLNKGGVFASATVTLVCGIFLPYLFQEIGTTLAVVGACGSYAGMVALKNAPKLYDMVIISCITAALYLMTQTAYVGVGGKLGTIAALACFSWLGIKKVIIKHEISEGHPRQYD